MGTFLKELQEVTISRVKNTLLISFILSWVTINYQIVLILIFSSIKIEDKINYIDTLEFQWDKFIIYPLLLMLIHQFILPSLNLLITIIKDKTINKWIREHKNENMQEYYKGQTLVETEKVNLKNIEKTQELALRSKEQEIEESILKSKQKQLDIHNKLNISEKEPIPTPTQKDIINPPINNNSNPDTISIIEVIINNKKYPISKIKPAEVEVIKLMSPTNIGDVLSISYILNRKLKKDEEAFIFDGYRQIEINDNHFKVEKKEYVVKNCAIKIVSPNKKLDNKKTDISNQVLIRY